MRNGTKQSASELSALISRFTSFAKAADNHVGVRSGNDLIEQLRTFVLKAQPLIRSPASIAEAKDGFQEFIGKSLPLVFRDVRERLPEIQKRANLLSRWLVQDDLLAVAGCRFVENAYTELMAWALHPKTHLESGSLRQHGWLRYLGLDRLVGANEVCYPRTQVHTSDGIPDLVLQFESLTVGVEAKTASTEHLAPSGKMQTIAYAGSLREALGLPSEHRLQMVFITPDGRAASNEEAICTTYVDFVLCLAAQLDGVQMRKDTMAAFAIFFTHMLTCASSFKFDVIEMVRQISGLTASNLHGSYDHLGQKWKVLLDAIKFLKPERPL